MKTQQLTQEKEQLRQARHSLLNLPMTLFVILGSPFYIIIGFTALTSYLSEKSIGEFAQQMTVPLEILTGLAIFSILLGLVLQTMRNASSVIKDHSWTTQTG